jgi:hypothetical protein
MLLHHTSPFDMWLRLVPRKSYLIACEKSQLSYMEEEVATVGTVC